MDWQPMSAAPRDETPVLLWTTTYGVVQAWFSAGSWSKETPISPAEYDGSVWVCADDQFQIEVEEYATSSSGPVQYHDGEAKAWSHLPAPPPAAWASDEQAN